MARKITKPFVAAPSNTPSPTPAAPVAVSTVSRNSPIPRPTPMKREITHDVIAKRAFEIFASGNGGSQDDNWFRAERELRGL